MTTAAASRPFRFLPRVARRASSRPGAYWQHVIRARVALARDEFDRARDQGDAGGADRFDRIQRLLDAADQAAARSTRGTGVWLTGGAINQAFTNLHTARVLLARYAPADELDEQLRSALVRLRATMPETEARRQAVEQAVEQATGDRAVETKRWALQAALELAYAAADAQYARLRSFRNILCAVSAAMVLLAVALVFMGLQWPASLQMCFGERGQICPTGTVASGRDALAVAVLGATGGALAAAFSIRKLQGTVTPYGVPLALALVKLPLGALSALTGLLLIHGRFIPGLTDLDTSGQILAYAVLLGVGQQAMTALIDRRAQELLDKVPYKRGHGDPPAGAGGGQPAAPPA
jgi:hypothetical protein